MKRTIPVQPLNISSADNDEPSQSNGTKDLAAGKRLKKDLTLTNPAKNVVTEELLMRSAKMYQEYMQQIPIPAQRGSVISFTSWSSLAKSLKQMYKQPLHYLTNIRVKEWDQMRIKNEPLDTIIHPCKAESNIWLMEEVHRLTPSYQFLAKLWLADPMYNVSIDSVSPQLGKTESVREEDYMPMPYRTPRIMSLPIIPSSSSSSSSSSSDTIVFLSAIATVVAALDQLQDTASSSSSDS